MILTPQDIERITRSKQPATQRRRLSAMGIGFVVNSKGEPILTVDNVTQAASQQGAGRPNFEALS